MKNETISYLENLKHQFEEGHYRAKAESEDGKNIYVNDPTVSLNLDVALRDITESMTDFEAQKRMYDHFLCDNRFRAADRMSEIGRKFDRVEESINKRFLIFSITFAVLSVCHLLSAFL